jgi:hypothetical protein
MHGSCQIAALPLLFTKPPPIYLLWKTTSRDTGGISKVSGGFRAEVVDFNHHERCMKPVNEAAI